MRLAVFFLAIPLLASCQTVPPAPTGFSKEQVAVLESYDFVETDGQWELGLEGKLLFPFDQSSLAPEQLERLKTMAARLLEVGIAGCRIDGHTDAMGSEQYNRELSLRRAEVVRSALIAGGMEESSVQVRGMGASRPIENNSTAQGRRENRRVTIIVSPGESYSF
ncbi:OmpA family protein [Tsuneonella sp. CC-YZS046]|uniref:OmpA family protein n=1 Tax=Tsuneonella sp. CC-YZS046 TaxID=3042152 RepID=UPI002D78D294|nr:OmpA family protein [Tsuneonella sp. CC-YZS046]WRO66671.1 OmpA family protein [Tsuneonella sp. CC-YZS046]